MDPIDLCTASTRFWYEMWFKPCWEMCFPFGPPPPAWKGVEKEGENAFSSPNVIRFTGVKKAA